MTSEDKVLLETRFRQKNITDEEFDKCLSVLLGSKEISISAYSVNGISKLEIVEMSFKKVNENDFEFNGSLTLVDDSDIILENRSINGVITFKGKKIYLLSKVHRYSECEHKDYEVGEMIYLQKGYAKRDSFYQYIADTYIEKINLMSQEQVVEYKENFVKGLKI